MALNSLFCADVPLSNYSLTHSQRRAEPMPTRLLEQRQAHRKPATVFRNYHYTVPFCTNGRIIKMD